MSGIVALLHHDGAPADRELLERMTLAQRYRGPDGEGVWCEESVGFGHTLHKTTLEAEHEQQPAALGDRIFITADARIDARDELCDRLRACGIDAPNGTTDADLILKAYAAWGEGCFEHLLGDFSFALWDGPNRKLVCAVDHLGVKPFYYANRAGLFAGSNSLECVRMHPGVRGELNEVAVGDFILFGFVQDRDITIDRDIARIPPGHFLVVEHGALRTQRYFALPEPHEVHWSSHDACIEAFEELLARAVRDRLRTPRVAIFMSGGVDSTLIAQTAKRELRRQFESPVFEAFTNVFDRLIPDDERHYAGLAAASLGIPVHFQSGDDGEMYDWVERYVPAQPVDSPVWGPWSEQLARVASRFSVALTGYDGDALLGAAARLHWVERVRERRFVPLARELAWYVRHQRALPPIGVRTSLARLRDLATPAVPRPAWLRADFCRRTGLDERWRAWLEPMRPVRSRDRALFDARGSAWGTLFDSHDPEAEGILLDVRHPLADVRVLRFAFGLPAVPWCIDKWLLRRCLHELPPAIVRRPKTPLQDEPDLLRFRAAGLGRLGRDWRTEGLAAYVDLRAIEPGLEATATSDAEIYALLRVVSLGLWVQARAAPRRITSPAVVPGAGHRASFRHWS
jgi:asparagine synthase (glutamine-hydrolysing)